MSGQRCATRISPVLLAWIVAASCCGTAAGENIVNNPDFESGFENGGLAKGWIDASGWADVEVAFSKESKYLPPGRTRNQAAQRIDVTRFTSGRAEIFTQVKTRRGREHKISLWMASAEPIKVTVKVRKLGSPYNTYAVETFPVDGKWKEYRFRAVLGQCEDPVLMVQVKQTGTLWVDNVRYEIGDTYGFSGLTFEPPTTPVPATLFGLHFNPFDPFKGETAEDSQPFPAIPFKSLRLHDANVSWNWLERERGKWRWDVLDNYLDLAGKHEFDIHYVLAMTPTWASVRPDEEPIYGTWWMGCAAPPKNIEDWRNFVRTVVTRCKGRVKYYEGWNEPDVDGFYSGTKEELITLQKEMYRIVKEIDPEAQVISPAPSAGGVDYLDQLLALGLNEHVDIVGFHFYASSPEYGIGRINQVKAIMRKHGCDKPLFDTESGFHVASAFSDDATPIGDAPTGDVHKLLSIELAAARVARKYLVAWAMGIPVTNYYRWAGSEGFTEADGQLKQPIVDAYRNTAKWMTGSVMTSFACRKDGTFIVTLNRDETLATVMWRVDDERKVRVPAGVTRLTDVTGKEIKPTNGFILLGETPVLMPSRTATVEAVRTWKDATGKFSVKARFASYGNGVVTLEREDGKRIKVPLAKLSSADKEWIDAERRR